MKLSRILVSVNLAATIPVAVQATANANEVMGDGALKGTTASLDKSAQSGRVDKKSAAINKAVASAKTDDCFKSNVRVRPFNPNAKLPSEKDMELKALTPKMAPEPQTSLNGMVSSFYAPTPTQKVSPAAAIGLGQTKSKRERVSEMTRSVMKYITESHDPPAQKPMQVMTNSQKRPFSSQVGNESAAVPNERAFPMMRQAERVLLRDNTPGIEQFGSSDMAIGGAPQQAPATVNSAGPPPFPLNLLPEESLKQLVKGSSINRAHLGPRVYFGCWHNNGGAVALPHAGFQNYSNARVGRRILAKVERPTYATRADGLARRKRMMAISRDFLATKPAASRKVIVPVTNVAVYPPYNVQNRVY
jgi:hypothetical protein